MPNDFKYTLTRFCLRSGRLTLPYSMRELFPSSGNVDVLDTKRGESLTLTIESPRTLDGLEGFIKAHHLEVNDEIYIQLQEDGNYSLTPKAYTKKELSSEKVMDKVFEQEVPLSEAEMRALYPQLPAEIDLESLLLEDDRFTLQAGRWHTVTTETKEESSASQEMQQEQELDARAQIPAVEPKRISVTPYPRGVMFPGDNLEPSSEQDKVDVPLQSRYRKMLVALGYRVEGLHGQLLARAELGRRQYSVLIYLLAQGEKLDWAALMAKRREIGANYIAVFGHSQDLVPLIAPTELARASLWSWEALDRLEAVVEAVPLSPYDLESHFERDGLFENGLERFEKMLNKRIIERGVFSGVLTRLSTMKAPVIFMLDDVIDNDISRDRALKMLELLSQAPFHLVNKVDSGEFCLRYKVSDCLVKISEYSLSLHDRLPNRRTERLQAVESSELYSLDSVTSD